MKRTSSEGKALDEHPTKDDTTYTHRAKSHVSYMTLYSVYDTHVSSYIVHVPCIVAAMYNEHYSEIHNG